MNHFPLTRGGQRAESDGEIVFLTPVRNVDVSEGFPSTCPCPGKQKGLSGLSWSSDLWRPCYCWLQSYQALIVSLFNRSELDCLFVSLDQPGPAVPSFILPVIIRTQACPALVVVVAVVDCSKTYNYIAGTIFATLWWCLNLYRHRQYCWNWKVQNISSWTPLL